MRAEARGPVSVPPRVAFRGEKQEITRRGSGLIWWEEMISQRPGDPRPGKAKERGRETTVKSKKKQNENLEKGSRRSPTDSVIFYESRISIPR